MVGMVALVLWMLRWIMDYVICLALAVLCKCKL